jgi:hypothetical protein
MTRGPPLSCRQVKPPYPRHDVSHSLLWYARLHQLTCTVFAGTDQCVELLPLLGPAGQNNFSVDDLQIREGQYSGQCLRHLSLRPMRQVQGALVLRHSVWPIASTTLCRHLFSTDRFDA